MKSPRYWARWAVEQGGARWFLRLQARRDNPFARLIATAEALRDPYPQIEALRAR
ncbi:cytochrome P450, partial [Nocardia seriolae]|nr:cytochrome P450 [Nocardia seriolae]